MTTGKVIEERKLVKQILGELRLRQGEFFINGSGAMAMYGVHRERPMSDLDIFTTTAHWFDLVERFGYTRTTRVSAATVEAEAGRWWLIQPERHDSKRWCDPPIMTSFIRGLRVDIFLNWRRRGGAGDFDPAFYLLNAHMPEGIPCAPLQFIMDWKLAQGRNKDLLDVIAIREHMGLEEAEL